MKVHPAALQSPLAWVGVKSRLRAQIIERIPPHMTYVELFAGAAWVLLGKDPATSKCEVLNDLDGELMNFWRVLKHRPAEFAEAVSLVLASRELWNRYAAALKSPTAKSRSVPCEVERAVGFYLAIKCGFSGHRIPTSFTAHRFGRPKIRLASLREEFGRLIARLQQVWIERLPWQDCLQKYDSARTFFYVDPPYRCGGSKAYAHRFQDADHQALAEALLRAKGKWMLSYNDDP